MKKFLTQIKLHHFINYWLVHFLLKKKGQGPESTTNVFPWS